jgi:hypothetical protein
MKSIFNKIIEEKGDAIFYMGSQTTPPCQENTYHLILTKPLIMSGCQFKLLREHTLISNKPKNIHARLEQPTSDRVFYQFNTARMRYIRNLTSSIPQSYNKFLLKMGGFKMRHRIICTKKGCFKRLFNSRGQEIRRRNDVLGDGESGPDCTIPDQNKDIHDVNW